MNVRSFEDMLKSAQMGLTGDQYIEEYFSKALATSNSGPGGHQSGPLMLENLDALMTEVLITEQHFKLFNYLPKVPSSQPYYEYNRHKGFGSNRAGGAGFRQGGAPKGGVSSFERKGIYNKYIGVQGGVTHQMKIAAANGGSFEDPEYRENRDRPLELLEKVERECVFGSRLILDESGEEVNYDGLLTQLAELYPENVIDMKGAALGFDQLDAAAQKLITKGKQPTVSGYTALSSSHVLDGLNQQFAARNLQRFNKDLKAGEEYTPGSVLTKYDTQFGTFKFDYSILFDEVEGGVPAEAAPADAPATPAITTQPAAAVDAVGVFDAGTYYYSIAAFNDTGESLPVVTDAVVATANTPSIATVITRTTGATGYRIYRGALADGSDAKWIAKVPQSVAGNITFTDVNAWRTTDANGADGNGISVLFKPDTRDLAVAQMSPLMKMPLPQVGTTFPFLLLLYMVPVVKSPERLIIYKNCGTYKAA